MSASDSRIGFIGAGNMAEAMAGAMISSGNVQSRQLTLCDLRQDRLTYLETQYNVHTSASAAETFDGATTVVLAVKPQGMGALLEELRDKGLTRVTERKQIITIAAGLPLSFYEEILYDGIPGASTGLLPILRVMPNTPSLVLAGMSGLCGNRHASPEDMDMAETILSAMGDVLRVTEDQMDGVTAVSGSGPAYFFYVVEAMINTAKEMGFEGEDAKRLALGTINGAAKLLLASDDEPEDLRRKVTSPGGTTEAAINEMKARGVEGGIREGMLAAARRSREMKEEIGKAGK
ncbi:pyrroline-5-carboxylate reductase [Desulfoluna spongiiphila]|uniref:Pyrroline-5-carboxylate reductase n=1 Tax=Desulfoluna spongiiphila TaxID=419481 RepID=A0A1G5BG25_9BACT|nr:pyrroline-5-carboxylate reductase [Desulfoluna spongiiphila]SCX89123.1 pyrroline-5-carboxylate reductase [Desulfoluna spongiiphila]VVS93719.1 pyrroline-5-carboxylate reductase [Desulfoluna spongiiphila]